MLRIANLTVEYHAENNRIVRALDNVSLNVPSDGYTLGVVGESGSGKTTLGLSIMNVIEPPGRILDGSDIEFGGGNVLTMTKKELRNYRWKQVAMVYQSAMNSLNPVKPISNPIVEVIRQHTDSTRAEAWEKATKLLSEVGINVARAGDYPHEFSGGMRQRVSVALALALSPKLLIADEPTSALDVVVQKQILALIRREVKEKNLSLIFITHEISLLCGIVENVAVMYKGEVVEIGPIDKILFEPLHPYTEILLATLLTMDSESKILSSEIAKKSAETMRSIAVKACKYSNRCKYAFDRCRGERPSLREIEPGRWAACHKY